MIYILDYQQFKDQQEKLEEIFGSELVDIADKPRLKRSGNIELSYEGIRHRTAKSKIKTLKFTAIDNITGSGKTWQLKMEIPDYRDVSRLKKDIDTKEKVEMAVEAGDIKIFCSCPDFLYKGYKYIAWELEYGIEKEDRKPVIKNPDLQGSLCKHGLALCEKVKDFADEIADDIDKYQKAEAEKNRERRKNKNAN